MNPAIRDQALQGQPADLATNWIEAGQQDRLRGVVDDQIDTSDGFEGPDVAALAADDPALPLIRRRGQPRNNRLARPLAGGVQDLEREVVSPQALGFLR